MRQSGSFFGGWRDATSVYHTLLAGNPGRMKMVFPRICIRSPTALERNWKGRFVFWSRFAIPNFNSSNRTRAYSKILNGMRGRADIGDWWWLIFLNLKKKCCGTLCLNTFLIIATKYKYKFFPLLNFNVSQNRHAETAVKYFQTWIKKKQEITSRTTDTAMVWT